MVSIVKFERRLSTHFKGALAPEVRRRKRRKRRLVAQGYLGSSAQHSTSTFVHVAQLAGRHMNIMMPLNASFLILLVERKLHPFALFRRTHLLSKCSGGILGPDL